MSDEEVQSLLAPFRDLGAGAQTPVTSTGERVIFGLQCHGTTVGDAHVRMLLSMPDLHAVGLSATLITNDAILLLAKLPNLESLDLDDTQIDDTRLGELASCPRLEFLHICRTQVTATGVLDLKWKLPNCEILSDFDE